MANNYKTDQVTLNAANTDFTILTASASTTLVKNITWIHEGHNTSVKLSLTKSGGTKTVIGIFAATSNISTKIWTDILPLEAGDVLHLQSDHISSSDVGFCVISYVINTASVSGQSIGVLTDVDLTGNASGKILAYNGNQFAPIANSSPSDTDSLTEGSSNLYFTDARVAANSAVTANTAKTGITSGQASAITANTAKTTFPGFGTTAGTALAGNTSLLQLGTSSSTALAGDTTTITSGQALAITANSSKIEEVEEDTAPKLGGDLDTLTQQIKTSTTNGNVILNPNGTGFLEIKGNQGGGSADNPGAIRLNCAANTHGVTIKSPAHASEATYTLVLPTTAGGANQVLKTNGSGVLSWVSQSSSGANYATNELITSSNTVMESGSTTSNKIADVVGAAVASRDNANAKKLLGFHTGSGNYVLRGMVNAGSQINGSAAGSPLWLGASGAFDSAPPTTTNHYSRIVGYFIGTGQASEVLCYFDPSQDWIQIDS